MLCPSCGFANPGHVQFCTHCHATLYFRCPHCWHEQSTHSKCEKCGLDMDNFWLAQFATAKAAQIKETAEADERNQNLVDANSPQNLATAATAVPIAATYLLPAPLGFIASLFLNWAIPRWRRYMDL